MCKRELTDEDWDYLLFVERGITREDPDQWARIQAGVIALGNNDRAA